MAASVHKACSAATLSHAIGRVASRLQATCRRERTIEDIVRESGTPRSVATELATFVRRGDILVVQVLAVTSDVLVPGLCAGKRSLAIARALRDACDTQELTRNYYLPFEPSAPL